MCVCEGGSKRRENLKKKLPRDDFLLLVRTVRFRCNDLKFNPTLSMMIWRLISERKHVLIVLPVRVQRVHILRSSRRRVLRLKRRGSVRDSNTNRDGLNGWDEHGVHLISCVCVRMCGCCWFKKEREGGWFCFFEWKTKKSRNQRNACFSTDERRDYLIRWWCVHHHIYTHGLL